MTESRFRIMLATTDRRRPRFGLCIVTWLTLAIMLYAIAFAQFLAVDTVHDQNAEFHVVGYSYPPLAYGWPVPFVEAKAFRLLMVVPYRNSEHQLPLVKDVRPFFWSWSRPWPWEWEHSTVNQCSLSVDLAVWLAILVSTALLSEMRWRRTSGRWQISLRGLLGLFVAVACLPVMIEKTRLHEWLDLKSGFVSYSYIRFPVGLISPEHDLWHGTFLEWRLNVALVAIILCFGLACAIYTAGMLVVRILALATTRLATTADRTVADTTG
jgi:hypothetical protein